MWNAESSSGTDKGNALWKWIRDKRNGKGLLKFKNGDHYDGEWKDDKRNGKGITK